MPVTPSRICFSTGKLTSGVKKKYSVFPSGVMKGESSAPAVLTSPDTGTGCSYSLEEACGGVASVSGDIFIALAGILVSLSILGRTVRLVSFRQPLRETRI